MVSKETVEAADANKDSDTPKNEHNDSVDDKSFGTSAPVDEGSVPVSDSETVETEESQT